MSLFIQGREGESKISLCDPEVERFSLDLCRAVKQCRKCVLEVGCVLVEMGLDGVCMEFVTACFFFSFLLFFLLGGEGGAGVLEHPIFLNNIFNCFPDASK